MCKSVKYLRRRRRSDYNPFIVNMVAHIRCLHPAQQMTQYRDGTWTVQGGEGQHNM